MNLKLLIIIGLISISSCSVMRESGKHREVKTKILKKIAEKRSSFAKCGRDSDIYKYFESNRVKVILYLNIDDKGQLAQFRLDNRTYPEIFSECLFDVVELISFPKNNEYKVIHVEQPFIFSKK